ncbi:hypothetical protein MXB_4948 [Myxobolus squamalis]|nr:hypothetical protein MXB_4948 [Myxobolus squamalis]
MEKRSEEVFLLEQRRNILDKLITINSEYYRNILEENERIYECIILKFIEYPIEEKLQVVKPAILTYENLFYGKKCELAEMFNKLVPLVVRKATNTIFLKIRTIH